MTAMAAIPTAPPGVYPPQGTARLFAAGPGVSHVRHLAAYGALDLGRSVNGLIDAVEVSGLTGRGGAGVAAWRKLASARAAGMGVRRGDRPVVIGNGAEGEPCSFKDQTLLRNAPHLVIDGLLCMAAALSASQLYIYAGEENLPALEAALAQRPDASEIQLVTAAETFVAGQSSAVVNAIATGRALPLDRGTRLSRSGLHGRPTVVHNVETLAHIALIARFGSRWFRSVGAPDDPGTRLISVGGDVPAPVVLETAGGTRVEEILAAARADLPRVQAVLVGGYHGRWIADPRIQLSQAGKLAGAVHPGAGVVLALNSGRCGLEFSAEIAQYLAGESARQCGPCMFGLPMLAETFSRLAAGDRDPRLVAEVRRLGSLVAGRGACHHPDGSVRMLLTALDVFAADVQAHLNGECLAEERRLP